ncbi:MAG TPA: S-layer homology domain-containing protein, partial [Chloroflexia bacterium]|nr:S-layer homology domain-containing protein [Chloroflexia bacterium]
TEHWNGNAWAVVASPNPSTLDNNLYGVAAVGANDVWAVGSYDGGMTSPTLTEHWNGSAWTSVASPNPGVANELVAAVAVSTNDVWAVGDYCLSNCTIFQTLMEHWNGSAWTVVPSPNGGTGSNSLYGVAAVAANDVWAVGDYWNDFYRQTLTEHYTNSCVTPTATSTPAPTDTPGPSPTPCTSNFADVHPTDYFYTPVTYLFCHGVISGYADGTFRPYNNTTRAQMVKIVVLGFAKPIVTPAGGAYTFADVPPSQPFFAMIETAAADAIVSGYACGGPGEPCDSLNRPYFRPSADVTRGQLSKIDVVAATWPLLAPAVGTFADVAPGSVFYRFVETAACHGVVSGYACGGPGEPCDNLQRPYYRPYNNATRGQIAKIVDRSLGAGGACPPAAPR